MNLLRGLAAPKKKDATGALTGRTLGLGPYTVKVDAIIGEGGFATIYRAVEVNTQEAFALKHFMLSGDPEAERDVLTEVAIMNALAECPHTLTMRAHAMSSAEAVLLLDLCEGSLATHVMAVNAAAGSGRGGGLSDGEVVAVFLSVAKAVAAMHALTPPLAHRDVKAENVLQHPEGRWVLCDFGSASSEQKVYASAGEIAREEERIRKQTTPAYRAPELWDLWTREHIGLPVDVWSLGCLLYLLAYGRLPFDGDAKLQILNGTYALPPGRPAAIEHLIQAMLIVDPKARISASHAVQAAESLLSSSREERPQAAGPQPPSSRETAPAEPRRSTFQSNTNGAEGFAGWKAEFGSGGSNSMAGRDSAARAFEDGWAAFGDLPAQGSPPVASGASAPAAAAAPAVAPLERPHGAAVGSRPGSRTSQSTGEMRPRSGTSNSSSGAGAGGSSALPPSAGPLAAAMEGLSMQTPHPQLQEHCQVLEQLLEERNKEVASLRAEMKRQASEARTHIETLNTRLASQERHLGSMQQRLDKAVSLRQEVESLKQQLEAAHAEVEALRRSSLRSNGSSTSEGGSRPGSSASGRGQVSSFPVSIGEDKVDQGLSRGMRGMAGTPMRQSSGPMGSAAMAMGSSHTKLPSHRPSNGQGDLFCDLDPLG